MSRSCDQAHSLLDKFHEMTESHREIGAADLERGQSQRRMNDNDEKTDTGFLVLLDKYSNIRKGLQYMESTNASIQASIEKYDTVVRQDDRDELVQNVEPKISKTRTIASRMKQDLQEIKSADEAFLRNCKQGAIQGDIRKTMYIYHMRKYFTLQRSYSSLANEFRRKVHDRARRELNLLTKEPLSTEQLDKIIEEGNEGKVMDMLIAGQEQEELERLMQRSNAVNQINREVRGLLEMFQEMAALVDAQQETVDNIVSHIQSSKAYTGEAAVELYKAAEYQLSARKKMACCFIIVLVIIGVIVGVIVATQEGGSNNNNNNN